MFEMFLIVAGALLALTLLYHLLPFRSLAARRPFIAFFPKYRWDCSDLEYLETSLTREGFKKMKPGVYAKGFLLGDFLPNLVKMKVTVAEDTVKLGSGGAAVLFDTGDFWKLAQKIRGAA